MFIEFTNGNNQKQIVGVVYRPNSPPWADVDIFSNTINDIMAIINETNMKCTIMGDVNIDLLKYSNQPKINSYLDMIVANGFLPSITKPTRITAQTATLIDHIYTNNNNINDKSGIIVNDLADH